MKAETKIATFKEDLTGRRVVVVGMAATGMTAAEFLAQRGAAVAVSEQKTEPELGTAPQRLRTLGVEIELGKHTTQIFLQGDLIVLSPVWTPPSPPWRRRGRRGYPS